MGITRRRFLGYTAGVVTAGLRGLPLDPTSRRCVLLDLNERGCFRESVSGYESALTSARAQWMRADAQREGTIHSEATRIHCARALVRADSYPETDWRKQPRSSKSRSTSSEERRVGKESRSRWSP